MAFGTDESVLFIEVSLIQRCPYREVPLYVLYIHVYTSLTTPTPAPPPLSLSSRYRGQLPHDQGEEEEEEEEEEMGQDEVEPKYERKYFWTHYVNCGFPNRVRKQTNNMHMYTHTW